MEEYWDRFAKTGRIMDYLNYKGIAVCMRWDSLEKEDSDQDSDAADCDEGEAIGESDYTDRHGACGGTSW
ncbi:hypothetical protein [Faecalicatena contorta]|uniref:hypothetical protein n=1 Tax=Faecalicatena contorta TaxID=39482 RepID=UPI001F472806|nr:hypothetical protein [Faecalicatena contorta]MCF2682311.1 hypothetical protein [Faecalicatena contorta]